MAPNKPAELTYFTAKLSDRAAKKTALQRAVSGMLKADWTVLRDLWFEDDEENPDVFDEDELGPEGDTLWSRILAGVGLFEETKNAYDNLFDEKEHSFAALDKAEKDTTATFPDVGLKVLITTEEQAEDNRLAGVVTAAGEAVEQGVIDNVNADETDKRAKALKAAEKSLEEHRTDVADKKEIRAKWNKSAVDYQQKRAIYLNSFPNE